MSKKEWFCCVEYLLWVRSKSLLRAPFRFIDHPWSMWVQKGLSPSDAHEKACKRAGLSPIDHAPVGEYIDGLGPFDDDSDNPTI